MPQLNSVNASQASATFLFCVESGYFENLTIFAAECIRRFGGAFSEFPILAVTPRFGPPLAKNTLDRFKALNVDYVRQDFKNDYSWYPYMNKALAAKMGDELATTEQVIWLDSDVMVVREPTQLLLQEGEDFTCCSYDQNVGSTGPDDPNEPYWSELAKYYGINIDDLPWVKTETDNKLVRFRLHSGVYTYRRNRGFGDAFVENLEGLFRSKIAYRQELPFPGDDVALAFAAVLNSYTFRNLPLRCNLEVTPDSESYRRELLSDAEILHFHHVLTDPTMTKWFLKELAPELPEVFEWLEDKVPLSKRAGGMVASILRRALKEIRDYQGQRFAKTCCFYGPA